MHVPTVVSYSLLQQLTAEQIGDIPVPGRDGGGARGGLQGFLPGQNSAAVHVEQTVDIPVPGRVGGGERGLQGFAGQSSTASSSHVGAADGAGDGVFRTFPRMKKSAGQGPHSGSELSADFNPSTLSAHQMPPEQLVDVPVPLVHERSSRSLVYEQGKRFLEGLHRRWEAEEAARLALLEEEQMDEDEEEEEVVVSRFLPHFRPRRWCRFVLAGRICPHGWQCTFAHSHTMSLSFIQTHGSAMCWWMAGLGFRGLASLGPFLGAPAGSPGQVKLYWRHGVRGLASPDPFLGAFRGGRTTIMEDVEVVQLVLLLGDRSWYASATDHAGCGGGQFRRASTGAVPGQGC